MLLSSIKKGDSPLENTGELFSATYLYGKAGKGVWGESLVLTCGALGPAQTARSELSVPLRITLPRSQLLSEAAHVQ